MESQNISYKNEEPKKLKWVVLILGAPLFIVWLITGVIFGWGLLFSLLSALGAPTASGGAVLVGIGMNMLIAAAYVLPIVIISWLYLKKRYWIALILILLSFGGVLTIGGSFLGSLLGRIGINPPATWSAPKGILIVSEDSLPKGFFHYENGKDFGERYIIRFFHKQNKGTEINYAYEKEKACLLQSYTINEKIACTPGGTPHECHVQTLTPESKIKNRGEEIAFRSYRTTFLINDSKGCAKVEFQAKNEHEAPSKEQMLNIINSLQRVQ